MSKKKHQRATNVKAITEMVKEIGEKHGIDIQSAEGNSHLDDLRYPKEDEKKLISILDSYLKDKCIVKK